MFKKVVNGKGSEVE